MRPRIPRTRKGVLASAGGVLAAAAVGAGLLAAGGGGAATTAAPAPVDGLPHTAVQFTAGDCGQGWTRPHGGSQVFDVRNASDSAVDVDLVDPATGAVYGEAEGIAPDTSRPLQVTLGDGTYAFRCLPGDADAVTGTPVRITGARTRSGPGAVPVTEHDLIPPTLRYQSWVGARMAELADRVGTLKDAVDRGDLAAARAAWLPAHLVYERMGAAYGAFGPADKAINGTTAGLARGVDDPGFTGFHRLEYGLWHGQSAQTLRGPADRLASDVAALRANWAQARMDPAALGLRAHEILENTLQFELTGRTDYGSGTNLATARANLDGTRAVLDCLRPLLTPARYPALAGLDATLDRLQHTLDGLKAGSGWPPLTQLSRDRRERVDADLDSAVEQLADVAAVFDVRRTS